EYEDGEHFAQTRSKRAFRRLFLETVGAVSDVDQTGWNLWRRYLSGRGWLDLFLTEPAQPRSVDAKSRLLECDLIAQNPHASPYNELVSHLQKLRLVPAEASGRYRSKHAAGDGPE